MLGLWDLGRHSPTAQGTLQEGAAAKPQGWTSSMDNRKNNVTCIQICSVPNMRAWTNPKKAKV